MRLFLFTLSFFEFPSLFSLSCLTFFQIVLYAYCQWVTSFILIKSDVFHVFLLSPILFLLFFNYSAIISTPSINMSKTRDFNSSTYFKSTSCFAFIANSELQLSNLNLTDLEFVSERSNPRCIFKNISSPYLPLKNAFNLPIPFDDFFVSLVDNINIIE